MSEKLGINGATSLNSDKYGSIKKQEEDKVNILDQDDLVRAMIGKMAIHILTIFQI